MQTGTIIYLTDAQALPREFDAEAAVLAQGLRPEWTAVAASASGYYAVPDALLELARRGAGRVDLIAAQRSEDNGLSMHGRRVRVMG